MLCDKYFFISIFTVTFSIYIYTLLDCVWFFPTNRWYIYDTIRIRVASDKMFLCVSTLNYTKMSSSTHTNFIHSVFYWHCGAT